MELLFASRKLATTCSSRKDMRRQFGDVRAHRLEVRLQQLRLAATLAEVAKVTGRCHELSGGLRGQLALDLDGPYRLLFSAVGDDGLRRTPGDWATVTAVVVERIHNYH